MRDGYPDSQYVDHSLFLQWELNVRALLAKFEEEGALYLKNFEREASVAITGQTNYDLMEGMKAVFFAAKGAFEGGYLTPMRVLIQSEVFDSELEQAEELLDKGYKTAAAVIAGVVLETKIRELADQHSIPRESKTKLDKLNADLSKANVYNKLMQKKITALANIRNDAAHGNVNEFSNQDVEDMIRDIRRFLENVDG